MGRSRRRRQKKINKLKVAIVVSVLIILFWGITVLGRYIYNTAREAYFTARKFYFTSDTLTIGGAHYQFQNWNGIDIYPIEIELYSYLNEVSRLDYNLGYTINCTTSSEKVKCTINSSEDDATNSYTGIIPADTNTSRIVVYVTPITELQANESVSVTVTASTTEPYQKTISCEFTLDIENQGTTTYSIEDVVNRDYAIFKLTNSSNATVKYTLEFDSDDLRLDMNDDIYINKKSVSYDLGNNYVEKIVFDLPAETTRYVKFYKVNKAEDFTYTGVEETSAIRVSV